MYVKRVQIANYGPIDYLDISLPFEGDIPRPVLLVGENGTGKTIYLSHIVNGLISAKDSVYPDSPEVKANRVYKIRSNSYIKMGREAYFARVDYEEGLFCGELMTQRHKEEYSRIPEGLSGAHPEQAWKEMGTERTDHLFSNFRSNSSQQQKIRQVFSRNCVLYFPSNRFEEPAWLNEENLNAHAELLGRDHIEGFTNRKIVNYSPLRENQNWFFDVAYDRSAFGMQTHSVNFAKQGDPPANLPIFAGYAGADEDVYRAANEVLRNLIPGDQSLQFGIGRRQDRRISIMARQHSLVRNIFQLSTGETSLLNLFLSILRDYELSGATFSSTQEVRGIALVDEIDLHLHVSHQYSILPNLIKMFPKVQFIVTTHSPLFILGMRNVFGDGGFALYRMPGGDEIDPEDFSEFGEAYNSFSETNRFRTEVRNAIEETTKPIIFVEGVTDKKYIERAAELLGRQSTIDRIDLRPSGGSGNLDILWNEPGIVGGSAQRIGLLYDCDKDRPWQQNGGFLRQNIHSQEDHPIKRGIENLFGLATISRARDHKFAFVDVEQAHDRIIRGETVSVPERWSVNSSEKTNFCNWLCENGTADDFKQFVEVFDIIEKMLVTFEGAKG